MEYYLKDYLDSDEIYQEIKKLQQEQNLEGFKENEESKRIRLDLDVLENIDLDNLKLKAKECKKEIESKRSLTYEVRNLDEEINSYDSRYFSNYKLENKKDRLRNLKYEIKRHEANYRPLMAEISGDLKREVSALKYILEEEHEKKYNSESINNQPADLSQASMFNTIISKFIENYLKTQISPIISDLNSNLEQIENEVIFPNGPKVKIFNKNFFEKEKDYNEESRVSSNVTHLNNKYQDPRALVVFDQIGKIIPTSQNDYFYYNERSDIFSFA